MLVARRDPFHPGAHDAAYSHGADIVGASAPRLARTVNMLQVVGSLLAIPVGIASAYSIYHANFSAETTCQSLRANIVSMIDKSVDAGTRHMLVRRDVEQFEQSCGSIDPDATAAFKRLLAADKPAAPVERRADAPPKEPVRKAEPHPQATAKLPASTWSASAPTAVRRDPAVSDAQWLDAVRGALLTHNAQQPTVDAAKAPAAPATVPAERPIRQEAALPAPAPMVAAPAPMPIAPPVAPMAAPTLPPATSVAAPAAPPADANHPVPPAAIPETVSQAPPDEHGHSRIRRWIAKIPLMGNVIDNGLP